MRRRIGIFSADRGGRSSFVAAVSGFPYSGLPPGISDPYSVPVDKLVRVYRERDTKLDRDVAIKVLPSALAQDPQRLARFEREAKVLAPLNHPNIAQIYDVEQGALVKPHMGRGAIGVDALHGADFELRIDRSFFDVQNS